MPPNVPIDGICSKPFWEICHGLDTLWPDALPVYRLSTCLLHYPSSTRGFPLGFPGGRPASGDALFLSFSPFPGPWPPFPVLCYKRYWWLCIISSKEAAESCCCSCCNCILMSDARRDRNVSFKITCPLQESKSRLANFWRTSFSLLRQAMGFSLGT